MRRFSAVPLLVLLFLLTPVLSAGEDGPPPPCDGFPAGGGKGAPLTEDPLAVQARAEKKVFIADFGLGTCFSCKQQKMVLDNIQSDYRGRVFVRFVNVWKEAPIADYHLVQVVPSLIFYDATGSIVLRHNGGMNYVEIADQLTKMGLKP